MRALTQVRGRLIVPIPWRLHLPITFLRSPHGAFPSLISLPCLGSPAQVPRAARTQPPARAQSSAHHPGRRWRRVPQVAGPSCRPPRPGKMAAKDPRLRAPGRCEHGTRARGSPSDPRTPAGRKPRTAKSPAGSIRKCGQRRGNTEGRNRERSCRERLVGLGV